MKRYPICFTNRDQSVAEHSFGVLVIALELIKHVPYDIEYVSAVTTYAIDHDIDEVFTGDIPSGFKKMLRTQCPSVIPFIDSINDVPNDIKAVVKLADYLEALYFLREFGGSRFARAVENDIKRNFFHACEKSSAPAMVIKRALELEASL